MHPENQFFQVKKMKLLYAEIYKAYKVFDDMSK